MALATLTLVLGVTCGPLLSVLTGTLIRDFRGSDYHEADPYF